MPLKAFLLCAGKGTRFYPHTKVLPKSLLPVLSIPLISYNLYLLKILGVKQAVVNIHAHPRLLKEKLPELFGTAGLEEPLFSHEQKLLGSAGGLLKLKDFFKTEEHFFYLNGDSFILPEKGGLSLKGFYSSHVESGALGSFLVRPVQQDVMETTKEKKKGLIYADPSTGRIHSFINRGKNQEGGGGCGYDFTGLAIFSRRIFREIKPSSVHIFKDVLESDLLKPHLRVHSLSDLNLLDMNQLSSYLKGIGRLLCLLRAEDLFLQNILNCFSPGWDLFQGENYFSASEVKRPPEGSKDILFCGAKVKGLDKLLVKNFAVLGDFAVLSDSLCMDRAVLGEKADLSFSLKNQLHL